MRFLKFGLAGGFTAACLLVACSGGNTIKTEPDTSAKPSLNETGKTPPIPSTSGSEAGQAEAHNRIRSKHKLPPLKWSSSLTSYAQQWANKLAASNNCNMEHRPNSGAFKQMHGENLYWASAKNWSDGRSEVQNISIKDAVDEWAKEEGDYNYASNSCKPGKQCGHYTQVVWKDTKEVGCASKQCGDNSQVWVCNYSPGGNVIGQKPY